jgi:hypothetical protein
MKSAHAASSRVPLRSTTAVGDVRLDAVPFLLTQHLLDGAQKRSSKDIELSLSKVLTHYP